MIRYVCTGCEFTFAFVIASGVVVDQHTVRLGMACPKCGRLSLIDRIDYPLAVGMTTIDHYEALRRGVVTADREVTEDPGWTTCGIVQPGDDSNDAN